MIGLGKGRVGCGAIAELGVDADVGRPVLPDDRRAAFGGGARCGDRRQDLVVDRHEFGTVQRRIQGLGDHRRHGVADEARLVGGEQRDRRDAAVGAVAVVERHVDQARNVGGARNGADAVGLKLRPGEHLDDAGHSLGLRGVDRLDAGVRVRRTHDDRMELPGQEHVAGIAAGAGEQALVFLASHRLADASGGDRVHVHRLASLSAVVGGPRSGA